jgi:hypothetical protein
MTEAAETYIVRLKITLEDVVPDVVRRIEVPLGIRLDQLHAVIQAAMGWTNSHLWEFRAGETGWSIPNADWGEDMRDASKAQLINVLEDASTTSLTYLYDFGDGWEHTVRMERPVPFDAGAVYPRLTHAYGRCPPEDIGGPYGYEEFLEALADPEHERHEEFIAWYDPDFDPKTVDTRAIERHLAALAKTINSKPAKPKRKTKKQ